MTHASPTTETNNAACPPHADFLGLSLFTGSTEKFLQRLFRVADAVHGEPVPTPHFVTYLNAHCVNLAYTTPAYAEILRRANCVYADGMAVVWGARMRKCPVAERVNAGDFIMEFCQRAAALGLRVALVGGRPGVAERCAEAMRAAAPTLQIVTTEHGFFSHDDDPTARIVTAAPDILLVGMGVPQQEVWAWSQREQLNTRVVWCVGALFEYYGEGRPRAPVWMRRLGLEWLVRLVLEPRRMWRRYLIGNITFIARVLRGRPIP